MIKTEILQSSKKHILAKPETIKIQHKSYKELLKLGRPKKRVLVESDNENDDFLEKLLREEQKEKKKKKQVIKRNISKNSKLSVPRKEKQSNDDKKSHDGRKENEETSEKSNDFLRYESRQHKSIEQEKQFERTDEGLQSPKSPSNIQIAKREKEILRNYSASERKIQNNPNAVIKIDDLDESPYITTQNIIRNASHTGIIRSNKGFKILEEVRKGQTARNFSVNPKLNVETKEIIHSFKNQVQYPPFKAKVLSLEEILNMCETRVLAKKKVVPKREKMFKNPEEDEHLSKYIRSLSQKSSKYM